MALDDQVIQRALTLLNDLMAAQNSPRISIVVCGGAALRMAGLHSRTTNDIDILALRDPQSGDLLSPAPLPAWLLEAASIVSEEMSLPPNWLNNGPSSGSGGRYQMGLPDGLKDRLILHGFGEKLSAAFISRIDQIYLKLYAAIDQPSSYHTTDLQHLQPTSEELKGAMRWARTHDPSDGFLMVASKFLRDLGYEDVASGL